MGSGPPRGGGDALRGQRPPTGDPGDGSTGAVSDPRHGVVGVTPAHNAGRARRIGHAVDRLAAWFADPPLALFVIQGAFMALVELPWLLLWTRCGGIPIVLTIVTVIVILEPAQPWLILFAGLGATLGIASIRNSAAGNPAETLKLAVACLTPAIVAATATVAGPVFDACGVPQWWSRAGGASAVAAVAVVAGLLHGGFVLLVADAPPHPTALLLACVLAAVALSSTSLAIVPRVRTPVYLVVAHGGLALFTMIMIATAGPWSLLVLAIASATTGLRRSSRPGVYRCAIGHASEDHRGSGGHRFTIRRGRCLRVGAHPSAAYRAWAQAPTP